MAATRLICCLVFALSACSSSAREDAVISAGDVQARRATATPTLDAVRSKDFVQCGVTTGVAGFSTPDAQGEWRGLDVDVCRAIAAAVLGDAKKVRFTPLTMVDLRDGQRGRARPDLDDNRSGPSGSGKSTLIRCLNRLEAHQSGRIAVDGIELTSDFRKIEEVRRDVGMVFQQFNLFPHLTILENCTLAPIWVKKLSKREANDVAMHYLRRVRIPEQANKYPGQLSGGQQQRVAIARSLCMSPKIMLFDEPTSALDPEMVKEVLESKVNLPLHDARDRRKRGRSHACVRRGGPNLDGARTKGESPESGIFIGQRPAHPFRLMALLGEIMAFDLQPTLQGELVELRPPRPQDFDDLYVVASDPLIWEQHPA